MGATLYQASQAIFTTREARRLPEIIAEVALEVMSASDVSLLLPGSQGSLFVAHSIGLPLERHPDTIALGERVARLAPAEREPVLSPSGIVYPLVMGDRFGGVLILNRGEQRSPFRPDDLERASALASQILLALENRRLLEQVAATERLSAIGQLAASVAHEINNPVACVLANLVSLRRRAGDLARLGSLFAGGSDLQAFRQWYQQAGGQAWFDEAGDALGEAVEGANRIREIIRDMRQLAGSADEATPLDLNEPIRSALRVARAGMRQRATVSLRLGANVAVVGNAGRLSQVFVNLLVNAAQASGERPDEPGEIVVVTRRCGDRVVAEVSDRGPGIRAADLPRIFEPTFTTKGPGTAMGLGLAISRDIVHRYGGEITVSSSFGNGATFVVDLPAATAVPAQGPEAEISVRPAIEVARAQARTARFRILFVDDEPTILLSYERSFGRSLDVVVARDGEEALAILAAGGDFGLIVCDLLMPGLSGMDVYLRACETRPELADRFVFVTGAASQKEFQAFVRTAGNQVLEKPFDFGDLWRMIDVRTKQRQVHAGSQHRHGTF